MNVCVLGLGQVGLPTARYVLSKGIEVYGYDVDLNAVEKAESRSIKATTDWNKIPPVNVYIICVSTVFKNNNIDPSSIFDVCEKISKNAYSSALVSIESTVTPRTCRKVYEDVFQKRVNLVHVPHRYWVEDPITHGVKQLRIIGGVNSESLKRGLNFYRNLLKIPLHVVSSIEMAEMAKITENSYRYVQIAFAEELRMICGELKLNFDELRETSNTKWNIEIREARNGIRGHCLPKDIRSLARLTRFNTLLRSAITVDETYRKWLLKKRE